MYVIVCYIPEAHCEAVKNAMFDAGAGWIGHYDRCSWQTAGQGQFRPMVGANPFAGEVGQLEVGREHRVEMVCEERVIRSVVQAMKLAHPYEEVAYHVLKAEPY